MDSSRTCVFLPIGQASRNAFGDAWLCFAGISRHSPGNAEPPLGAVDVTNSAMLASARPVLAAQAKRLGASDYTLYVSHRGVPNFLAVDTP